MLRRVLAVVSGVAFGGLVVGQVEGLSKTLSGAPPPPIDPAAIGPWMDALPIGAKLGVVLAWALGGLAAGVVAALAGREHGARAAVAAGGLMSALTFVSLSTVPFEHPAWMWIGGIVLPVALGALGGSAVMAVKARLAPPAPPASPAPPAA